MAVTYATVSDDHVVTMLPGKILAQIDEEMGTVFVDRADFIRAAVRHYLEYLQATGNNGGDGR